MAGTRLLWFIAGGAAAWAVQDLLAAGELPHLRSLLDEGWWQPSTPSSPPCTTLPALATLLTGRSPAAHGVVGSRGHDPAVETVWTALSKADRSVAVAQLPWVGRSVAGTRVAAISSWPEASPPEASRREVSWSEASRPAVEGTEPVWQATNLPLGHAARILLGQPADPSAPLSTGAGLLRAATRLAEASVAAGSFAASSGPDVLICYQPCVDAVSRAVLTQAMLDGTDRHSEGWHAVVSAYRMADAHLGRLLVAMPADAAVIVSSDHGIDAAVSTLDVDAAMVAGGLAVGGGNGVVDPERSLVCLDPYASGRLVLSAVARALPSRQRRSILRAVASALREVAGPLVAGIRLADDALTAAWVLVRPGVKLRAGLHGPAVQVEGGGGFSQVFHGQPQLHGICAVHAPRLVRDAGRRMVVSSARIRGLVERVSGLDSVYAKR